MDVRKKELIARISQYLKDNNIRKPITIPKQVFHISDDNGTQKDFVVKQVDKTVMYTTDDIATILNVCMQVIKDALKSGEEINIYGFGKLGLRYRSPRELKNVLDGKPTLMRGCWIPRFWSYNDLKRCAMLYEQSLTDKELNAPPIYKDEPEEPEEED